MAMLQGIELQDRQSGCDDRLSRNFILIIAFWGNAAASLHWQNKMESGRILWYVHHYFGKSDESNLGWWFQVGYEG